MMTTTTMTSTRMTIMMMVIMTTTMRPEKRTDWARNCEMLYLEQEEKLLNLAASRQL